MARRIGHTEVEVTELTPQRGNLLKEGWHGEILINGVIERFCTDLGNLQSGKSYWVVYERTETLAGEPIVKIHEITDQPEDQTDPQ